MLGQPFWARRFAGILNRRAEMHAQFLSPGSLFSSRGLKAVRQADFILRMGYRPGGPSWRGRIFDGLWACLRTLNPRAKGIHYWIGTDVLNTLEDSRAGVLRAGPMKRAQGDLHWADAPWLVEELAEVGLQSRYIALPVPLNDVQPPERLPAPFTVLTYIPDRRYDFYDGSSIYQAALNLPGVRFEVIGGSGTWVPSPLPNLVFFGWQEDVRPFLARASVAIRLVRHDGMGGTIREALEAGLYAIYSQRMPCVTTVPYQDPVCLEAALKQFHQQFEAGELPPNHAGHQYVRATFDLEASLDTYLSDLHRSLNEPTTLGSPLP